MAFHRTTSYSVDVTPMLRNVQTSAGAKELTRRFIICCSVGSNIRSLTLGPVFQNATQNVSLDRLVQALPDDVKALSFAIGLILLIFLNQLKQFSKSLII